MLKQIMLIYVNNFRDAIIFVQKLKLENYFIKQITVKM